MVKTKNDQYEDSFDVEQTGVVRKEAVARIRKLPTNAVPLYPTSWPKPHEWTFVGMSKREYPEWKCMGCEAVTWTRSPSRTPRESDLINSGAELDCNLQLAKSTSRD